MVTTCLALFIVLADAPDKDRAARELAQLQGTWTFRIKVVQDMLGERLELMVEAKLIINGVEYRALRKDRNGGFKVDVEGRIEIDPKASPKAIDLYRNDAPAHVGKGIYQIEGKTLKLAIGKRNNDRPKDFKPSEDVQIITLTRE